MKYRFKRRICLNCKVNIYLFTNDSLSHIFWTTMWKDLMLWLNEIYLSCVCMSAVMFYTYLGIYRSHDEPVKCILDGCIYRFFIVLQGDLLTVFTCNHRYSTLTIWKTSIPMSYSHLGVLFSNAITEGTKFVP